MATKPRAQQDPEAARRAAEAVTRGEAAKALAEHPLLRECLAALEQEYLQAWLATEPGDTAARERLHMAVRVVGEFRRHLRTVIDNGTLGREHLTRLRNGK